MKKRIGSLILAMLLFATVAYAEGSEPAVDPNAGEYVKTESAQEPVIVRPNVTLPGWQGFQIAANKTEVEMYLPNPVENAGWYDLTFEVWIALPVNAIAEDAETQIVEKTDKDGNVIGEVPYTLLYRSQLVPAGKCLQFLTIAQPVPVGTYDAFVHMQPYYVDSNKPTSNSGNMNIVIQAVGE